MLDFQRVRDKEITYNELVADLTVNDLRDLTNEMMDLYEAMMADCSDADVVFQPIDEEAHDPAAATDDETDMAWTLGHLVVHVTASSEEAAFLAAEMARGVTREGRSRYETHWTTIKTMEQVHARMAESRRMIMATLNVWPDDPDVETMQDSYLGKINAVGRFVTGLGHATSHIGQMKDVIGQAKAA